MVITYQGENAFKISQGDLTLAVNPKSKTAADITLISLGRGETSEKSGFVVSGPGEYEIKEVSIKGFLTEGPDLPAQTGKKINTIYVANFEGINLCFLGELSKDELSSETLEQLEDIDILFTPISAYKLAVKLEPSIIIPANYAPDTLKKFLKEAGEDSSETMEKLVIKKKDLEGKEGEIVVLKEE